MNKEIIKHREFKSFVHSIGRKLTKVTSTWQPDYIVGITRGGLYPALLLSHYLDVPMHTLNVSLRESEYGPESNLWMAEDAFGYYSGEDSQGFSVEDRRKNILIVDDINDTGATFNWIVDDWQSSCLPNDPAWKNIWNNNVRFCAIVDNAASEFKHKIDYSAMKIDKSKNDCWIVFPWENQGE